MVTDQAWLDWRRAGVTATDVAKAATGVYGGLWGVVADKLDPPKPDDNNPLYRRGLNAEQPLAAVCAALTGLVVSDEQLQAEYRHDRRWRATLDGILRDPGTDEPLAVMEIKTSSGRGPVAYWQAQTQWQTMVVGLPVAVIVEGVFRQVGENGAEVLTDVRLRRQVADGTDQARLRGVAETIWGWVQSGRLPPPDVDVRDRLKARWTPAAGVRQVSAELLAERERLRAEAARVDAELGRIESAVMAELGDAERGEADGFAVTWRASSTVDVERLRAQAPWLVAAATKPRVSVAELRRMARAAGLPVPTLPGPRKLRIDTTSDVE